MIPLRAACLMCLAASHAIAHGGDHPSGTTPASGRTGEVRAAAAAEALAAGGSTYAANGVLAATGNPALLAGQPGRWSAAAAGGWWGEHGAVFTAAAGWLGADVDGERFGAFVAATGVSPKSSAELAPHAAAAGTSLAPRADHAIAGGVYGHGRAAFGANLRLASPAFAATADSFHDAPNGDELVADAGLVYLLPTWRAGIAARNLGAKTLSGGVAGGFAWTSPRPPVVTLTAEWTMPTQDGGRSHGGFGAIWHPGFLPAFTATLGGAFQPGRAALTCGLGWHPGAWRLAYGFMSNAGEGPVHTLGVSWLPAPDAAAPTH